MSGSVVTPKEVIAVNCAAVMAHFNMKHIPNVGMFENIDGSIEYHWRTDSRCERVLVFAEHYLHVTQDKRTGAILGSSKVALVKTDGTFDFHPVRTE